MKLTVFISLSLFLTLAIAAHSIVDLRRLQPTDLHADDLIEIIETSQNHSQSNLAKEYYVITSTHRDKREAYHRMNGVLDRVIKFLLKQRVIPDEDSLAKSKTRPKFLSKQKRWSFETIFAVYGRPTEIEKCTKQLARLGVKRLTTKPSISFLNEKMQVLAVFNSAKNRVWEQLENLPSFQIVEVVDIEIEGKELANSDELEAELEEDFNEEKDSGEEDVDKVGHTEEHIWMKVVFRVAEVEEELTDDPIDAYDENTDDFSNDEQTDDEYETDL